MLIDEPKKEEILFLIEKHKRDFKIEMSNRSDKKYEISFPDGKSFKVDSEDIIKLGL